MSAAVRTSVASSVLCREWLSAELRERSGERKTERAEKRTTHWSKHHTISSHDVLDRLVFPFPLSFSYNQLTMG